MLEREKAYQLAGRKHKRGAGLVESEALLKRRELRFHPLPADQAQRALSVLAAVPGLTVEPAARGESVWVTYSLESHTLEALEALLRSLGFKLDATLYTRILRAAFHYCEETQLRNLHSPERLIKKSNEVYVQAYAHHLHGDHDETPEELREAK